MELKKSLYKNDPELLTPRYFVALMGLSLFSHLLSVIPYFAIAAYLWLLIFWIMGALKSILDIEKKTFYKLKLILAVLGEYNFHRRLSKVPLYTQLYI